MATFDAPQVILFNFEELSQNAMYFFLMLLSLHNTAFNDPVWHYLVKGAYVWCRI